MADIAGIWCGGDSAANTRVIELLEIVWVVSSRVAGGVEMADGVKAIVAPPDFHGGIIDGGDLAQEFILLRGGQNRYADRLLNRYGFSTSLMKSHHVCAAFMLSPLPEARHVL